MHSKNHGFSLLLSPTPSVEVLFKYKTLFIYIYFFFRSVHLVLRFSGGDKQTALFFFSVQFWVYTKNFVKFDRRVSFVFEEASKDGYFRLLEGEEEMRWRFP